LFVGGGCPKVLAVVGEVFFFCFACFVGDGSGAFFTEGGIGEDVIIALSSVGDEGILRGYGYVTVNVADVV
jgi:hypothetical protein